MNQNSTLISEEKTSIRARIILFLSFTVPLAIVFLYVWTTATDLVMSDDLFLAKGGFIESYLKGTLTFGDLWRPLNLGRMLGYNLMQLASIKWFSMNSRLLVLLVPFFMLASAWMIYREYRKSLKPELSPEFIAASFFTLTFILFNVIQWEGLIVGCDLAFQPATPFFIAAFISLELFITKGGGRRLPAALILPALAMLVFNGRLNLSFIPTAVVILLCYALINRGRSGRDFWLRSFLIGFFLVGLAFIYVSGINFNEFSLRGAADNVFARPWEAVQFLLAALGSSVIGIDVFSNCSYISYNNIVSVGLILVILYSLALTLFFRSKMHEKTYLPLFLIVQTFFFLGIMMIGRFDFGKDYGMTSRYTCVSVYGLSAMVWIFTFVLTGKMKPNLLLKGTILTGLLIIFAGLIMTSAIEWSVQPQRKAYLEELREIALRVDTASPQELLKIGDLPDQVRDSLILLRQNNLNVYRKSP